MVEPLPDSSELLFRQIHPNFMDNGEPSSQAFVPTAKDENRLSVDRASITTAEQSFSLFTKGGRLSIGAYGLTVAEFASEEINAFPDPVEATGTQLANPAHAYADYSSFTANQQKNKAKRLKLKAKARGILYDPG